MEVQHEELTPEEQILAEKLRFGPPTRVRFLRKPWFRTAAAAVLLAASFLWWYVSQPQRRAERLLAEAYTQQREFEWRLQDRGWSRRKLQRAPKSQRSASLIDAEALLGRGGIAAGAELLDLQARAALLEFDIDTAIKLLREAVELDGASAALQTDLAAAYGLRAESETPPISYGAVVEHTTRAIKLSPRFARAWFNRALAYERLSMPEQAIADWEAFLRIESDAGWIKEATERLRALRELKDRRASAMQSVDGSDAALDKEAVAWLVSDPARARASGEQLARRYGDRWLTDAAAEHVDGQFLSRTAEASRAGEADDNLTASRQAIEAYRTAPAHQARVRLEEIYALNRLKETRACLDRADALIRDLRSTPYHWIRVQARMYRSSCHGMLGDPGASTKETQEALAEARRYGLEGLELLAIGRLTSARINGGEPWAAWQENRLALTRMQATPYSVSRIQQCLTNYSTAAEQLGWYAASMEFMRAAADVLVETPNRLTEAACRARSAAMALAAGFPADAKQDANRATQIFLSVKASKTRARYLDSVHLLEAEVLLHAGQPAEALALMPAFETVLPSRERWRANQLIGTALMRLGRRDEAVRHLEDAIGQAQARAASQARPAARALARREGLDAYRLLATVLVEQGLTGKALEVWLAAHGSRKPSTLVFLALNDGYAVWREARFVRIRADRAAVRKSIRALLNAAGDPTRSIDEIQREGRWLYGRLIEPAGGMPVMEGVVTILPDAELSELPFSLLARPGGQWFAECWPIALAPQPEVGLWRPLGRGLIAGNIVSSEAPAPLPEFGEEAAAARMVLRDSNVLTGDGATAAKLTSMLPAADLFHFAGHGYSSAGHGGVYLADQPLVAAAIRNLALDRCRLVVLSACLTGIGENSGMANSESLVRAFLDAGAGAVLASRWSIDSAATARLMRSFYGSLAATGGVANSLRAAASRLKADPRFAHPYYWAAFQVYE